jgi:type II secretory pathway component GspD/PulD (secretin)
MATISEIVSRLDTTVSDVSETRIFHLLHADATEMSSILTTLYSDPTTGSQQGNRANNNRQGQPNGGGNQSAQQLSQRALLQARMVAVPDPRTNSIIVTSSHDAMEEIALTIGRLDASESKKQHIHIYTLENADPGNVTSILRAMFTVNGDNSSTQQTTDVLSQRTTTGASSDVVNTLNTGGNSGGGSRSSNGR